MTGATAVAGNGLGSFFEYERLEGELDASIVFAAAGREAYQCGNTESGDACLSDARDCYAKFTEDLASTPLDHEMIRLLDQKVWYLRALLDSVAAVASGPPSQNEAA
jgi:hypothetical protein